MKPCGTEAAYYRHRYRGEEPCAEDRQAVAEIERARKRAKGRRARRKPRCGTRSGYEAHLNAGTTPCRGCKDAHAEAQAEWRRGRSNSSRHDKATLGDLIVDLLETHGRPLTTENLTDFIVDIRGAAKQGTVRSTLLRLAKDGRVESLERYDGWYWRLTK